jgi:hypothetical protein
MFERRVILLLTLCSIGCATPGLYYENTGIQTEAVSQDQRRALVDQLSTELDDRTVHRMHNGSWQRVRPGGVGLNALSLSALRALYIVRSDDFYGGELDVVIRQSSGQYVPVQIQVDGQGDVRIWKGEAAISSFKTPTGFFVGLGLRPLQNGSSTWNDREQAALALALQTLSPQERAVLKDIPFVRTSGTQRNREGGRYHQENCDGTIHVYDRAFSSGNFQFVGQPRKPMPAAMMTILHEIGHALHSAPGRQAICQHEGLVDRRNQRAQELNAAVLEYNRLVSRLRKGDQSSKIVTSLERTKDKIERLKHSVEQMDVRILRLADRAVELMEKGPIITAYANVLDGSTGPTRYGESSIHESFAEAFALFRADPRALRRTMPNVFRWFHEKGHTRALNIQ